MDRFRSRLGYDWMGEEIRVREGSSESRLGEVKVRIRLKIGFRVRVSIKYLVMRFTRLLFSSHHVLPPWSLSSDGVTWLGPVVSGLQPVIVTPCGHTTWLTLRSQVTRLRGRGGVWGTVSPSGVSFLSLCIPPLLIWPWSLEEKKIFTVVSGCVCVCVCSQAKQQKTTTKINSQETQAHRLGHNKEKH